MNHAVLQNWVGKWVVVSATHRIMGLDYVIGRLTAYHGDGMTVQMPQCLMVVQCQHIVAIGLLQNQDDVTLASLAMNAGIQS